MRIKSEDLEDNLERLEDMKRYAKGFGLFPPVPTEILKNNCDNVELRSIKKKQ